MGAYEGWTNYWVNLSTTNSLNGLVTDSLALALDAGRSFSYAGSGTTWTDLSGNGRHFTWTTTPTFTSDGALSYFSTLGKQSTGPASNSFGITNTSGYTIFLICNVNSLLQSSTFQFYGSDPVYGRGIFSHIGWTDDNIYFDQGGCCGTDVRTTLTSAGVRKWNLFVLRRLTNSSTRYIHKNGAIASTNTVAAVDINLTATAAFLGDGTWDAKLNLFYVYNRGLTDNEVVQNSKVLMKRFGV